MFAIRFKVARFPIAFSIWIITFYIASRSVYGRTWPRFVSMRSFDTATKIYSKPLANLKSNDYNRFNSGCSKETGDIDIPVNSTCIAGPFHKNENVNSSVYNLLCPSSSSPRDKLQIQGMCGWFVQCKGGNSFLLLTCDDDKEKRKTAKSVFNEETGKCETSPEECHETLNHKNMSSQEILDSLLGKLQTRNERKLKEPVTLPAAVVPQSLDANEKGDDDDDLSAASSELLSNHSTSSSASLPIVSSKNVNEELEDLCKTGSGTHGLHPHPYLCNKYIQCGAAPGTFYLKTCGPGTVFNPRTLNCDWPSNVDGCNDPNGTKKNTLRKKRSASSSSSKALKCELGGKDENREVVIPDPDNCNKYHVCSSAGNVYSTRVCGAGTLFNPLTSVCDFADNVDCSGRKNDFGAYACDKTDAYFAPHPDRCNKFIECENGVLAVKACPPGTVYNREKEQCDHTYKVTCRKPISLEHDIDSNLIRKSEVRKKRSSTSQLARRLNLACEFNYIAPHPHNCHQFVECEDRRLYVKNCGYVGDTVQTMRLCYWPGTAFNPLLGQCDWPDNVRQSDPNDCTRYRQCVRTHYQLRTCPSNQFFDENRGICVYGSPYELERCSARSRPTTRWTTPRTTTEYFIKVSES